SVGLGLRDVLLPEGVNEGLPLDAAALDEDARFLFQLRQPPRARDRRALLLLRLWRRGRRRHRAARGGGGAEERAVVARRDDLDEHRDERSENREAEQTAKDGRQARRKVDRSERPRAGWLEKPQLGGERAGRRRRRGSTHTRVARAGARVRRGEPDSRD